MTDRWEAHILLYALKVACHHAFAFQDKTDVQVVGLEGETRGGLAERFKAAVLKTAVATLPGVRIPHPPPFTTARLLQLQDHLERWVSGLNHSPAKTAYASTESSNLSLSAKHHCVPVAQLDRASDYGSEGQGFESLQVHHKNLVLDGVFSMALPGFRGAG